MKTFEDVVRDFQYVRSRYREFGAGDSEIRHVAKYCLEQMLDDEPFKVPTTIQQWQLYDKPGAGVAAKALTAAFKKVLTSAKKNRRVARQWLFD